MTNLIKALPKQLRKNGYDYSQVLRGKSACIYAQHVSPNVIRYEVFKIKIKPAITINGKRIPPHERFPGNEDFGKWAWCCWDLVAAKKRFNELELND